MDILPQIWITGHTQMAGNYPLGEGILLSLLVSYTGVLLHATSLKGKRDEDNCIRLEFFTLYQSTWQQLMNGPASRVYRQPWPAWPMVM